MRARVTSLTITKKLPPIFKIHLVFWTVGALSATGATVWPGTSRMTLSGTYCIPSFEQPYSAFFFFGVAIFPTVIFLAVQYIWIFVYIRNAKLTLQSQSHMHNNTRKQLKLARQLGSLVVVYFIFYTPMLCSAIYEWNTHYFAVVSFDAAGVLAHISSVLNPVIYLWTTKQAISETRRVMTELKRTMTNSHRETSSSLDNHNGPTLELPRDTQDKVVKSTESGVAD